MKTFMTVLVSLMILLGGCIGDGKCAAYIDTEQNKFFNKLVFEIYKEGYKAKEIPALFKFNNPRTSLDYKNYIYTTIAYGRLAYKLKEQKELYRKIVGSRGKDIFDGFDNYFEHFFVEGYIMADNHAEKYKLKMGEIPKETEEEIYNGFEQMIQADYKEGIRIFNEKDIDKLEDLLETRSRKTINKIIFITGD
jgi:hypothetical protein